jgi:hypothetical protein
MFDQVGHNLLVQLMPVIVGTAHPLVPGDGGVRGIGKALPAPLRVLLQTTKFRVDNVYPFNHRVSGKANGALQET